MRYLALGVVVSTLFSSAPVLAASAGSELRRETRYDSAGPWNVDLAGGAMLFGGHAQATLDLLATRTFWTHLKLGGGVGLRGRSGVTGIFPQLLVGLRFPFGTRVTLDLDWRVGYGAYHIDNGLVLPLWRDVVMLAPSVSARLALSRRFEVWVAPFAVTALISGDRGFVSSWIEPHAGVSLRF